MNQPVEVAAIASFVGVIAATWRRNGEPLVFYDYYIVSALVWFVAQAVCESRRREETLLQAAAARTGRPGG